jgi:hypothetical protein
MLKKFFLFLFSTIIGLSAFAMDVTVEYLGPNYKNEPACKEYHKKFKEIEREVKAQYPEEQYPIPDDVADEMDDKIAEKVSKLTNPCFKDRKDFNLTVQSTDTIATVKKMIFDEQKSLDFKPDNQKIGCGTNWLLDDHLLNDENFYKYECWEEEIKQPVFELELEH